MRLFKPMINQRIIDRSNFVIQEKYKLNQPFINFRLNDEDLAKKKFSSMLNKLSSLDEDEIGEIEEIGEIGEIDFDNIDGSINTKMVTSNVYSILNLNPFPIYLLLTEKNLNLINSLHAKSKSDELTLNLDEENHETSLFKNVENIENIENIENGENVEIIEENHETSLLEDIEDIVNQTISSIIVKLKNEDNEIDDNEIDDNISIVSNCGSDNFFEETKFLEYENIQKYENSENEEKFSIVSIASIPSIPSDENATIDSSGSSTIIINKSRKEKILINDPSLFNGFLSYIFKST